MWPAHVSQDHAPTMHLSPPGIRLELKYTYSLWQDGESTVPSRDRENKKVWEEEKRVKQWKITIKRNGKRWRGIRKGMV